MPIQLEMIVDQKNKNVERTHEKMLLSQHL